MDSHIDKDEAMDDLLVKYLLKEATPEESSLAENWIAASPDHHRYYEGLKQVWQTSRQEGVTDSPDTQKAWRRFQREVITTGNRTIPVQTIRTPDMPSRTVTMKRLFAAAAVLLVLITGGWLLYHQLRLSPGQLYSVISQDQIRTVTLSDGTVITLNKHSKLDYPIKFSSKNRTVGLQGEAFFNVAQQTDRPFIVQVNNLTVTVLGTSFNIDEKHGSTEVIVETGRVKVTDRRSSVQLSAHEKIMVHQGNGTLKKVPVSGQLYDYYRTGLFVCHKTPLRELLSTLGEVYDVPVVIADSSLGTLPLTTTFHRDQPLDTILSIISQTFNQVNFRRQGEEIILTRSAHP
jgi:ferric-dicitrate binding protein FerR (iron transport regulator)